VLKLKKIRVCLKDTVENLMLKIETLPIELKRLHSRVLAHGLRAEFISTYVYDYINKVSRKQAETIQNPNIRAVGEV
jgi:hypothetical protein